MKKIYGMIFAAIVFAAAPNYLCASPSFSGSISGSAGLDFDFPTDGSNIGFKVPLAGVAAVQANLANWCVARGEIALDATNFEFDDIFGSAQSSLKLNELSLVLIRRAVTASSFFSVFLGSYEQVGSDVFLMRQFGIEPISSDLAKSASLLGGVPILSTKGAGLSYIVNFDKAPIATGGYIYFGKNKNKDWTLNFDARFSFVSNLATIDLLAGIGSPLQDSYNDQDVVLMIDTITLHGGMNFLLGSSYTHSLLLQAGIKDVAVKGNGAGQFSGDMLNLLIEPRINFNKFRFNLTVYSYDSDSVKDLMFLENEFGAAVTFCKDDFETKNGFVKAGIHAIGAFGGNTLYDFVKSGDESGVTYNAYITPYAEFPVSPTARFEIMAQLGVCDISGSPRANFKFMASAKKTF